MSAKLNTGQKPRSIKSVTHPKCKRSIIFDMAPDKISSAEESVIVSKFEILNLEFEIDLKLKTTKSTIKTNSSKGKFDAGKPNARFSLQI